jgi:hypothetical protein
MYVVAVLGTVLILVVLSILDRIEALTHRRLRIPPRETHDAGEPAEDEGKSEDHLP